MTVSAKFDMSLSVSQAGSNAFSSGPFWSAATAFSKALANGTTANKVNLAYVAERTVASGANDDIDVAGSLVDALGASIVMAEVVAILIKNEGKDGAPNTTDLTIGGSTSGIPGYTAAVATICPGGWYAIGSPDADGLAAVTPSTGDILRITNAAGASNKYTIAILGRSA
ncbi:hypothetical protein N182_18580 [Sinorhizobium sp. GL2]|nr:hypothetical protein N182_18580 [Sinorhizobium sp. GL2]